MKRVGILLISVLILLFISTISLYLTGFFDIKISFESEYDFATILLIIISISIFCPVTVFVLILLTEHVIRLFKPKFIRVAEKLERVIARKQRLSRKLNIPLKKEQVINKMEIIWRTADMQYPLSELDFEKIMEIKKNA